MKRKYKNIAKRALMWITTFALLLCEIPFPAAITFADESPAAEAVYEEDYEAEAIDDIEEDIIEEAARARSEDAKSL